MGTVNLKARGEIGEKDPVGAICRKAVDEGCRDARRICGPLAWQRPRRRGFAGITAAHGLPSPRRVVAFVQTEAKLVRG